MLACRQLSPFVRLAAEPLTKAINQSINQCLPDRPKPDVLRPGIAGMRGSMVTRLRPRTTMSTPPPAWSVKTRRAPSRHCRTARFLLVVISVSSLYPLLVFLPSVWSFCGVLMLVHQPGISYRRTDRTSKQQPCPRDSICALSACLLRVSFF